MVGEGSTDAGGRSNPGTKRGFYIDSLSRAYYAMFCAARAAAGHEGFREKKHSGVILLFGRLFAKTYRIHPRLHKALTEAFEEREDADYMLAHAVTAEAAETQLRAAEEFV